MGLFAKSENNTVVTLCTKKAGMFVTLHNKVNSSVVSI